jgi:hypothetical protein
MTQTFPRTLLVLDAATEGEIDAAFAAVDQQRPDAMVVAASPFFLTRSKQIAGLAARRPQSTLGASSSRSAAS